MGKSKKVTVGYRYFLSVHLLVCRGPVDRFLEFVCGERTAYEIQFSDLPIGEISSTIQINKPNLFGGDKREGGVKGRVDILMGEADLLPNPYLLSQQGPLTPAYRGLFSLVFSKFQWSAINPYFKQPWIRATRVQKGWCRGAPWLPIANGIAEDHNVNLDKFIQYDANPAHIIYETLTDFNWGMGYDPSDIDEISFTDAAHQLRRENFGLSLTWSGGTDAESFIKEILDHISAVLRLDLKTGKFVLKLIRGDYITQDLTVLNQSNIIELKSHQRPLYKGLANKLTVIYRDRNGRDIPVTVNDPASIKAQGAVVTTSITYRGIRTKALAARVAIRDLNVVSTPLAKIEIITNRVLWDAEVGDVYSFNWPEIGYDLAAFRIVDINKGTLVDGKISATLVEDVFGLSDTSYTQSPGSIWQDPLQEPSPVEAAKVIEIPYYILGLTLLPYELNALLPGYGFALLLACRGITKNPTSVDFYESSTTAISGFTEIGSGSFAPTGVLVNGLNYTDTAITIASFYDLAEMIAVIGGSLSLAVIDNEFIEIVSINQSTGVCAIKRGALDTVPNTHAVGARVFFLAGGEPVDSIERTDGELAYYKAIPRTGLGDLPLTSAANIQLIYGNRATRPYPPGKLLINNLTYPGSISSDSLTVTWAHRDRLQQLVGIVDTSENSIGPELGTTYNIAIIKQSDNSILQSFTGLTGTSQVFSIVVTKPTLVRLELYSVRGGLESTYKHSFVFLYSNAAQDLSTEGGIIIITEDNLNMETQ